MRAFTVAVVSICATLAWVAPAAHGAFGDDYRGMPINGGPGSGTLDVPALPGASHFFWAGVCDRGAAPGAGSDLASQGGIGTMPSTATAPSSVGFSASIVEVPLLGSVRHCIDWRLGVADNGLAGTDPDDIWETEGSSNGVAHEPPSWRLPDVTGAGGHPDGSATFAFVSSGDPDNIYVDLPPGFVGNPNAVPKCSAEQFSVRPHQCPAASQVGILTITLWGGPLGGENFGPSHNVNTVPVFNLEPRRGNTAELGLVGLSRDARVPIRLVAKARTNGDFGVTTFAGQLPGGALPVVAQAITLWGVPWAAHNDVWRAPHGVDVIGADPTCTSQAGTSAAEVIPPGGLLPACRQSYDPSWGEVRPFITTETDCNQEPLTRLASDVYQRPGAFTAERDPDIPAYPWPAPGSTFDEATNWKTYVFAAPPVDGCESLPFEPDFDVATVADQGGSQQVAADAPAGLDVDLTVPQRNDLPDSIVQPAPGADPAEVANYLAQAVEHWTGPDGRATAHLKDTVFTLPEGMSLNPSSATGLDGCSDAQIGLREQGNPPLFNNGDPFNADDGADGAECPESSRIGTMSVDTPLLEQPLTGELVLGSPKSTDPQSGEMFRLFIVARLPERGLIAKVYGSTVADPATGQLTTTFLNNPEVPFESLSVDVHGGDRGVLANPPRCNSEPDEYQSVSSFTPWSRSHLPEGEGPGTQDPVNITQNWVVDQNCAYGFNPGLKAGMSNAAARKGGTFGFEFTRPQGDQWLRGLTAELPTGLLATVKDLPLCTNAQANAGNCPAASRIGLVDASAGSGDPFVLEKKGEIFLTEGYKGGPYGLAVKVRAIAGPFRGEMELDPIIVRQKIEVDPTTAQVKAISDPFPTVWHGVPLRVRRVLVNVDRPNFMLNPSDCSAKQVKATLTSTEGTARTRTNHFQARGCKDLPFKPRLALTMTGKKQSVDGGHPGLRAVVRQAGNSEAGIGKAVTRLPLSLALDPENAQELCEFTELYKDDIEKHCPKGSIIGRARAISPLLNDPLVGNVYFVKNRRINSFGNSVATLPALVVALRGEVDVNLRAFSAVERLKLVTTFPTVPDAPITQFNLNIKGGRNGILTVVSKNLCGRQITEADFDGQNGKRRDLDVKMKTPCAKKKVVCKTKKQKRTRACKKKAKRAKAAKRKAAAKRAAASRRS